MTIREEMYKNAKEFDSKIISFETAIKRPYFHVRPLDDPELENWHNYLDFIEGGDGFNKVCYFIYIDCLFSFCCVMVLVLASDKYVFSTVMDLQLSLFGCIICFLAIVCSMKLPFKMAN